MPAISLPAGFDSGGLPIGVQLHGSFGARRSVAALAAQVERARPDWFGCTAAGARLEGD